MNNIMVRKASGRLEPFSEDKLRDSLKKAKASPEIIEEVVRQIVSGLKDGASTFDIYSKAFSLLRKKYRLAAGRYRLKNAIMELGPTGYPFERFVAEILKSQGFSVEVGQIAEGACVAHELDIVATKNNRHIMAECKFHNQAGIKSDIKTALYVQARFEDLKKKWQSQSGHGKRFHQAWLITNTKLTSDAIKYASCVGINAIGWSHPPGQSLQDLIEDSGLHPLTSLTTLSLSQKRQLLEQGFVLCRDILKHKNMLGVVGIDPAKINSVLKEIEALCTSQSR